SGASGRPQNPRAGALARDRWRAGKRPCTRAGRRHLDRGVERRYRLLPRRRNTEGAITRRGGPFPEIVGAWTRSRRLALGRGRKWSQPDQERARDNADHGERIALRSRSLDHRRRPVVLLAVHAVRAFAYRTNRD